MNMKKIIASVFLLFIMSMATSASASYNDLSRVAVGMNVININKIKPVVYTTRDGGVNWATHILEASDDIAGLNSVNCNGNNGQYCVAIGIISGDKPLSYISRDGGLSWEIHTHQYNKSMRFVGVICDRDNSQYCTAVGSTLYNDSPTTVPFAASVFTSNDGGVNWTQNVLTSRKAIAWFSSISCSGTNNKYCTTVGAYRDEAKVGQPQPHVKPIIFTTEDGGVSWRSRSIPIYPTFDTNIRSISCNGSNGQYCTAVGVGISYSSNDGGFIWRPYVFPQQGEQLESVSCNGDQGQYCVAVGNDTRNLIAFTTADAGATWTGHIVGQAGQNTQLHSVVCTGDQSQYCTAVGNYSDSHGGGVPIAYTSIDNGNTWVLHNVNAQSNSSMDIRGMSIG
jgi:photosystem II stability/assembly factor-like uncharacterized protein